jgi:hypothetical protein
MTESTPAHDAVSFFQTSAFRIAHTGVAVEHCAPPPKLRKLVPRPVTLGVLRATRPAVSPPGESCGPLDCTRSCPPLPLV